VKCQFSRTFAHKKLLKRHLPLRLASLEKSAFDRVRLRHALAGKIIKPVKIV
jgi:hypothetical protein